MGGVSIKFRILALRRKKTKSLLKTMILFFFPLMWEIFPCVYDWFLLIRLHFNILLKKILCQKHNSENYRRKPTTIGSHWNISFFIDTHSLLKWRLTINVSKISKFSCVDEALLINGWCVPQGIIKMEDISRLLCHRRV